MLAEKSTSLSYKPDGYGVFDESKNSATSVIIYSPHMHNCYKCNADGSHISNQCLNNNLTFKLTLIDKHFTHLSHG